MEAQRISASEFLQSYIRTKLTVVDLRTPAECEQEYINGCLSLPIQNLNKESFTELLSAAKYKSEPVYLLCQSGMRAEVAVEKLKGSDEYPLVIIEGGLNALKKAGINTVQGTRKTISLDRQVRIVAGGLVLVGVILGLFVTPFFYALSGFVGAGLVFAGLTDSCAMGMLLARMPWNQAKSNA